MSNEFFLPVELDFLLVGRDEELRTLSEALLRTAGGTHPVAVTGSGGMGKTALVAWFAKQHAAHFRGGYLRHSDTFSGSRNGLAGTFYPGNADPPSIATMPASGSM
jgi:ATP-dependent Clp protease ATP-binding subunit ClpA